MNKIDSYFDIEYFKLYLKRLNIDNAYIHNFGLLHRRDNKSRIDDLLPHLSTKNEWLQFFCVYVRLLKITKSDFKLNDLLVKKEI